MISKKRSVLGIDVSASEVRVVEMRGGWSGAHVCLAGATDTPAGAIDENGLVVDAPALGSAVKALIERMGATSHEAVIGLPPRTVVARVIEVPRIPDAELPTVIEGELAHYQIVTGQHNAIDFLRLEEQHNNVDARPQALVVTTPEPVVNAYGAMADTAALKLVALEPSLNAMYRAVYPSIQEHHVAACLAIGSDQSDIAIVQDGKIRLYRRVDSGHDVLVKAAVEPLPMAPATPTLLGEVLGDPTIGAPAQPAADPFDVFAATNLATELRRSMAYFGSQNPGAPPITRLVVAVQSTDLVALVDWFATTLAVETIVAEPTAAWEPAAGSNEMMHPDLRTPYMAAIGLALRGLPGCPAAVPEFDLSSRRRSQAQFEGTRRRLALSIGSSIAAIAAGAAAGLVIGGRVRAAAADVDRQGAELKSLQHREEDTTAAMRMQTDLLHSLRPLGYPLPRLVDSLVRGFDPKAGITDVEIGGEQNLTVIGEAASDQALIRTLDGLKSSPYIQDAAIDSFDTIPASVRQAAVVHFQIAAMLAGAKSPAAPRKQ